MVRAIIDGRKTQTRRIVKPQPVVTDQEAAILPAAWDAGFINVACPYGAPGDRLWVRETFYAWGRWETRFSAKKGRDEWHFIDMTLECERQYRYAADIGDNGPRDRGGVIPTWWKRPSIFMPHHASRITLEVAGVRVERLQDISEADALEEGITYNDLPNNGLDPRRARTWFRGLWASINGSESWEANPWVWVIEFQRVDAAAAPAASKL